MLNRLRTLVFFFSIFLFAGISNAQTTYSWTGAIDNQWTTAGNWSPSRSSILPSDIIQFNGGGSVTVTNIPSQTIRKLLVNSSSTVSLQAATGTSTLTINGPASGNNVQVASGSSLQIGTGTNTLILTYGTTANQQLDVSGTLILGNGGTLSSTIASSVWNVSGTLQVNTGGIFNANNTLSSVNGTLVNSGGTFTVTSTNTTLASGGTFDHAINGGTVPILNWNSNSTLLISGTTTTAPAGLASQTFGHLNWNASSQTASLSMGMNGGIFNGNVTITTTGSGNIAFHSGTGSILFLNGDLIVNGGVLNLNNAGATITTLNLAGNLIQTGGTFQRGASSGIQVINFTNSSLNKNINLSAGTYVSNGIAYTVNLNAIVTLQSDLVVNQSFTNNGTLNTGTSLMTGSGTFTLANASTATLSVGDPAGLTLTGNTTAGNIRVSGTKTYNTSANIIYNGTSAQVTGTGLASTYGTANTQITINNAAGVTLSQALSFNNNANSGITLSSGILYLDAFTLTLPTSTNILGTFSASAMIVTNGVGQLVRGFPASPAAFTFPVGDASGTVEYSPITFNFSSNNTGSNIGIRVTDAAQPNGISADYLTRYWSVSSSSIPTVYTLLTTAQFVAADVVGTIGNLRFNQFVPATQVWSEYSTTLSSPLISSNQTQANTSISSAYDITGRDDSPLYYRTVGTGNWNDASIWEVSTDPTFTSPVGVPAAAFPTNLNSLGIQVQTGHTATITANLSIDDAIIDGTVNLLSGITLTIANGTAANDLTINGTLSNDGIFTITAPAIVQVNGSFSNTTNSGAYTSTAATLFFNAGSFFNHQRNAGTIPTAAWNATSTLNITGITTTLPAALTQTFGHVTWNCSSQSATVSLTQTLTTVNGNLSILGTNSQTLALGSTGALTINVLGDLIVSGSSILNLNSGAFTTTLNLSGNYNQTAGTVTSSATNQAINFAGTNPSRSFTQSGGTLTGTSFTYTVNLAAFLTLNNNIAVATGKTFTVNGTLYCGSSLITGAGTFTLTSATTATLGINDANGIVLLAGGAFGNIQTTTARNYGALANYQYGSISTITGTGLTAASSVSFTNSSLSLSATVTLNGAANALSLSNSLVRLGNFDIVMNSTLSTIGGAANSVSNMIVTNGTGSLKRFFPTGVSTFTFPIGDETGTSEYTPVTYAFTALGTSTSFGVRTVDAVHPSDIPLGVDYLTRYWPSTCNAVPGSYTLTASYTYVPVDVVGTEGNLKVNQFYSTTGIFTEFASTVSSPVVSANVTNASVFFQTVFDATGRNNQPLYYRSTGNGNWNTLSTWEVSTDPTFVSPAPSAALFIPNQNNSAGILVRSGHTVTVNAVQTADDLTVDGQLTVNSTITLTINNGTAANDMVVSVGGVLQMDGIFTITAPAVVQVNGSLNSSNTTGAFTSTAATLFFNAGSFYNHNRTAGVVPTAAWNTTSTCNITGVTTTVPTGLSQTFGNFTWNCAGQTATISLVQTLTTVNGNLSITNSNNQILALASTGALTINVLGDLNVSGSSILNLNSGAFTTTFNLSGNYNQTAGTVTSSATNQAFNFAGTIPTRTYTQSGGTLTNTSFTYTINAGAFVTLNNGIVVATGKVFTVNGALFCGTNLLTGAGTFTLTSVSTATIGSGDIDGLVLVAGGSIGNIRTTIRNYGAAANYIYNGSSAQTTGTGFTSGTNLTINNASGVTLTSSATVSGILTLQSGVFSLGAGANNLSITNTTNAAIAGSYSASSMLVTPGTGSIVKSFAIGANPTLTFPIGDNTGTVEYTPLYFGLLSNSAAGTLSVRLVNAVHPNNGAAADYLSRYYVFGTTLTTYTYTLAHDFANPADITGSTANMQLSRWNGATWTPYTSTISGSSATITATLNNTTAPLAATSQFAARTSTVTYYRSIASGNWTTATNWETANDAAFTVGLVSPAAAAPTNANSVRVTIQAAHTITATSAVTAVDLVVDGTFQMGAGGTIAASGITFNATGVYDHNRDGSVIPTATWNAASLCQITGVTATAPTGVSGQTFGKFTWNSTGQTAATLGLAIAATTTFNGDFTVTSTGATSTNIISLSAASVTVNMNGKLIVNGGTFILNTVSITTLNVLGDLNVNGGTFNLTNSTGAQVVNFSGNYAQTAGSFTNSGTGISTVNFLGLNKTYVQSAGSVTTTNINYVVGAVASLTMNNTLTIAASRSLTITLGGSLTLGSDQVNNGTLTNNGTLICSTYLVTGTGAFTLAAASTATLSVGDPGGLTPTGNTTSGNIRVSGTKTYNTSANIIYAGTSAQVTGTGLAPTIGVAGTYVTINNPAGVTLSQSLTFNNTATCGIVLQNGLFSLGNFSLTLPTLTVINGTPSVTNMIVTNGTGQLLRGIPASAVNVLFPVGEVTGTTEYSPVNFNFTSNNTATTIGIRVVDARDPNDALSTDYLTRYWVLTNTSVPSLYTLTTSFTYLPADVVNTESNLRVNQYNTTTSIWIEYSSTVASPVLNTTVTNASNFLPASGVTVDFTGRVNAPLYYQSTGSTAWSTLSTWEVSTDPTFVSPAPVPAVMIPSDVNSAGITIKAGHTVSVTAAQTADDITVNGTLSVNGVTFTIANGAAANDMVVNGTLINNGTSSVITPTGILLIAATGSYQHAMNAGTVPAASWASGSNCFITGVTLNQPGGLAQTFHHFTWNCTGQSTTVNMTLISSVNWGGNFTILSTGATPQQLRLTNSAITLGIGGNLDIQGGIFVTQNAALTSILNITGNMLVSGTANFSGITTSGGLTTINLGGNLDVANTATFTNLTSNTTTAVTFNFTGVGKYMTVASGMPTQGFSFSMATVGASLTVNSPVVVGSSRTFNITAGSVILGTNRITGNGSFSIAGTNSYLSQSDPDGLVVAIASPLGAIRTLTARTYSANANYIYTGITQNLGTPIAAPPFVCNSLGIDAPGGVVTLTQNVNATTNLQLSNGILDLANFNLGLLNTSNTLAVTGNTPSASNMVVTSGTGRLIKTYAAGAQVSFVYPLGDNVGTAEYSPASITFSALGAGTLGLQVKNAAHPNLGAPSDYLNRYWSFGSTTITAYTYTAAFTYAAADVVGLPGSMNAARWDGSLWNPMTATTGGNVLTITSTPLNNTTSPLAATSDFTGRVTPYVYYFRSIQSGNWNDVNTWEVAYDAAFTTPIWPAPFAPDDANSASVLVRSGHVVTVTANTSVDQFSMDNTVTTTLTINSGVTFTLKDGAGNDFTGAGASARININGTYVNQGVQTGTMPTVVVGATGVYNHNQNGGTVYTATWSASSECLITGTTSTTPAGISGQTFGKFTWNTPSMTMATTTAILASATTFNGDFTLISTGTPSTNALLLSTTSIILTYNGDFLIQGGTLNITNAAVGLTLNLSGNYNQLGGVLTQTGATASTINFNGIGKSYTRSAGTVTNTNLNYGVNSATANFSLNSNIDVASTRTFIVTTGTLNLGTSLITGAGSFTLTSATTAGLGIGDPDGIVLVAGGSIGNVRTAARSYGALANYSYAATALNTGSGLTAANSLNFTGATINLSVPVAVSGTSNALGMNASLLSLGNNNLSFSNAAATFNGTFSSSNMVLTNGTGQFIRTIPASGFVNPYVFPIGGSTGYSPASLTFTAAAGGTIGAKVTEGTHPNMLTPVVSDYINRYWNFTTTGMGTYTYSGLMQYQDADIVGSEALLLNSVWDGSSWNGIPSIVDTPDNTLYFPGIGTLTNVSAPLTAAYTYSARNTPVQYYYRTIASGNWNDPAIWEISTDAAFLNPLPVGAAVSPDALNSLGILVRLGHVVNVTANVTVDQLSMDNIANSTIIVNSAVNFTLNDGPGNDVTFTGSNARIIINGNFINKGVQTGTQATVTVNANGVYEHNQNGGTVYTATWNASSECLISGVTLTAPTGISGQTFGKFTWNNPSQTVALPTAILSGATTFTGDFTVISTGTPATNALVLSSGAITVAMNADLLIQGGTLNLINAAAAVTLNLAGNYNQTGGTFTQTGATASTVNFNGIGKSYTQSGGTVTGTNINYAVNSATANFSLNNSIDISTGRTFNVNTGTLNMGTSLITGAGSFTLVSVATATLGIGDNDGIVTVAGGSIGNVRTATRNYGALANYIYVSTANNTGNGFVAATSVFFNNSSLNLSSSAVISGTTGALQMTSSLVSLGNNNLTLNNTAATITGAANDNTNMIITNGTGQFIRSIPAASWTNPYVWPIGTTSLYNPVKMSFTAAAAGTIGVKVVDAVHPSMGVAADKLNVYWDFTTTGLATYTLSSFELNYNDAQVSGSEVGLSGSLYSGGSWNGYPSTVDAVNNKITFPSSGSLTNATAPLNGFSYTGRTAYIAYYRTVASGNWNNPAIWEVATDAAFTAPVPAVTFPTDDNNLGITIRNGHVVQVTANVQADQITIDNTANSTLNINVGVVFTLVDGLGTDLTLNANSRLLVNGEFVNTALVSGASTTTMNVLATGTYNHAHNAGVVLTPTWTAGSTCLISGTINTAPTGLNQSFRNFTWNTPGLTVSNLSLAAGLVTVFENLTVISTGSGSVSLATSSYTIGISGDLILNGGTFNLNSGLAFITTLNIGGNYNQSGGTLTCTATSPSVINFVGTNKTYTQTGGTVNNAMINYAVNLAAAVITLNNGITLSSGRSFSVATGTLNMGTQVIDGAGSFSVTSVATATLISGSTQGLNAAAASGNVQTTGGRTFGVLANYTFAGSSPQNTGNGVTAATTLTINNASGVTATGPISTANLTLSAGVYTTTTANLLTITGITAIGGTPSSTACVSGPVDRVIPANRSTALTLLYPLGKGGSYNPFELVNPTTGAGGSVTVRAEVFNANAGGFAGAGFASMNTNRYWSSSITAGAANLLTSGAVKLTETTPALVSGTHGVGQCSSVGGTYAYKGGSVSAPTIQTTSTLNSGYGFFVIGTVGPITCPSPTLVVGPGGDFNSLTDASAVLNALPINCNLILELNATYNSSVETFPVTFNNFTYGVGGPFTVTVRPATGASPIITTAAATGLIVLNGADNLIFDGRPAGVGAPLSFSLTNTNVSGNTITLQNDAQNNSIRYMDISGSNTSGTSGIITISTAGAGSGNDNNLFEYNTIHGNGARPVNLIYASGTSSKDNDNNTISNNNFHTWGAAAATDACAIELSSYNNAYTISGNSFYQPSTQTTATSHFAIQVNATTAAASNYTISNNYIGGNAASASGTWTATTAGIDYRFCGISVITAPSGSNTISGNTVKNITVATGTSFQTQSSAFTGIYTGNGTHTISGNTIGSLSASANIAFTTSNPQLNVHGIFSETTIGNTITSNSIGGISVVNSASSANISSLFAIRLEASSISGTISITGNTIGNPSVANSLLNNTGNTYTASGSLQNFTTGIYCSSDITATISTNNISSINYAANGTSTGTGILNTSGIYRVIGGNNLIENNTIQLISSSSPSLLTGIRIPLAGIVLNASTAQGQSVRGNTIHTLSNLHGSAAVNVAGIVMNTPATPTVTATVYTNNFSNPTDWTLNTPTGSEGGTPNPWSIGNGISYPGGSCGAASTNSMYIRCAGFICDLLGGGGPVYQTGGGVYVTDRMASSAANISTIGYTSLNLNFAWQCVGATTAYGSVRYSIDGGSSWVDLPTQYRNQSSWQCASVSLPAECENISTLRIAFRWRNGLSNSDVDPPFTIANMSIDGQALAAVENAADKNFIHSITASTTSASASITGIVQAGGILKYRNNMIRLGIDATGSSINTGLVFQGFLESSGGSEYFHNSIYVGGSSTTGAGNSYCINSVPVTGTRDIRNNILWNARSNAGGTGKHYALKVGTLTNLTSDYNDLQATGSGAILMANGATDYAFLPLWHMATLMDLHSVTGDPIFVNATGNATSVNLHITPAANTPIESAGEAIGTVTSDFDNDTRASNTPTDIGADAGLFTQIDVTDPAITYTPVLNQPVCSGAITTTVEVNIIDNQTGLSTSSNLPRIYFRRKTGAPTTAWSTTNSVAGTFLSGTAQNSNWQFVVDYSTFGITIAANDQIEYYFVAQDQAGSPNVGTSQTNGVTPVHPSTATLTTPIGYALPANGFFTFNGTPLSGTVTVGTAGTYATFNGPAGLFTAINTNGINGDLTVRVISDISETAYTPLGKQSEFCGSGYHIRITPNNNTVRTITGTNGQTMIDISGAFSLTIDGRDPTNIAGGARNLIFRNSSLFPAIRFNNGASDDTLMYCQVQSKVQSSTQGGGVVTIGGPLIVGTNNLDNIVLFENKISYPTNIGAPALSDIPQLGIQFQGSTSSMVTNLVIKRNSIFNFQTSAIATMNPSTGIGNSYIGNGAVIDSNRIYQTFTIPTYQYPIDLDVNGLSYGHQITNNLIGGNAEPSPNITGTLTNSKSDGEIVAIYVNTGNAPDSVSSTSIQGNKIKNILLSGTGWDNFVGIRVENGRVRIGDQTRNIIGDSLIANNVECRGGGSLLSATANSAIMGIWTQSTEEVVIANNLVANLTASAPVNGYCFVDAIAHGSNLYYNDILYNTAGGKVTMRNNRVDFVLSASRLQNSAISSEGMMGYFVYTNSMSNVIEKNVIINSGVNNIVNRNVRVYGMHFGVYGSLVNQGGRVNNNMVASLANTASGDNTGTIMPELHAMIVAYGTWDVYNNQIFLRNGTTGTPITNTNTFMSGIQDGLRNLAGQGANYYNNTIYISGTNAGAAPNNASYAFLRFPNLTGTVAGAPIVLKNNLFINDRGGPGNHRAFGNVNTTAPATGWNSTASDYNLLFNATAGVTTRWGTTDYNLAGFQTISGGDANSTWIQTAGTTTPTTLYPYDLLTLPLYGDLHILLTNPTAYGFVNAKGNNIALVTTDIDGDARNVTTPDPGADEFTVCLDPFVTTQPSNQTVCPASAASFTAVVGGLAPLTYQWEESTDGGTTWNPLSNAGVYSGTDALTLNISSSTGLGGNKYHLIITNVCSSTTSNAATLNLLTPPSITTYSPPSFINNICALSNTGFGVTAAGDGLTYQWNVSTDNGGTWNPVVNNATYSGATNATMFISNTPASFHLNQYQVVVSGTCPSPVTSTAGVLNVGQVTLNTNPPTSVVVCESNNTTISVGATGNSLVYQWQISTNGGGTWNPLSNTGVYSGVDTQTMSITGALIGMNNYQYRVVIGSVACPSVTSTAAILTVNSLLSASVSISASPSTTICDGTSVTFTAIPVNGGPSPSYQWYKNAIPVGTSSSTYTNAALVNSDQIYVTMTSNAVCPSPSTSTSNTLTMTVNPILPVSVTISTPSLTVCDGSSVTFTATPVNGGVSPTYAWFVNGSPVGTSSSTYSTSGLINGDVVTHVLTSNAVCPSGSPANSNSLTMVVQFPGTWLGYTSDWNTTSNWGCGILPLTTTNVTIPTTPEGGIHPVVVSNSTAVSADLTIQSGASVVVNTGKDLSIYGDLNHSGSASMGAGEIRFRGSAQQDILGTTVPLIGNLKVDNSSGGTAIQLQQDIQVSGNIDMTDGSLDLNGYNIDLGTTGQLVNETNTERIFGLSGEITATRTLGTSTVYNNIAGLGVSITTDAVAPGVTVIDRGHGSQQQLGVNNSIQRYFDITPTTNGGLNATLKINYFDVELTDIDGVDPNEGDLIPWRSEDGGLTWEGQHYPLRLSNSAAANFVQLTQVDAFSRWTLSDWLTEPLPIQLLSFTAVPVGEQVNLTWVTASETNNDYFNVERSSDAVHFNSILSQDGAGNSTSIHTYQDVDASPLMGTSYYRLLQTDFNGNQHRSQIVPVQFTPTITNSVLAWVNSETTIAVQLTSRERDVYKVELFDDQGKLLLVQSISANKGINSSMIPNDGLASGVYLLRFINTKGDVYVQKLMIH